MRESEGEKAKWSEIKKFVRRKFETNEKFNEEQKEIFFVFDVEEESD